ncbi:hypothetical protein [Oricola indica]|uniref:hypothetical protein n=1 Tax=Oricola indica TaxID=2872591 RepID=UPI003CCBF36D
MSIEHPSGEVTVLMDVERSTGPQPIIHRAEIVRTARKLFEGRVFPHQHWRHQIGSSD